MGDFGFFEITATRNQKTGKQYITQATIEGFCKNVPVKIILDESKVTVFLRGTELGKFERTVSLLQVCYFIKSFLGVKPDELPRQQVQL